MTDNAPIPKDFQIFIDFDEEVNRFYVAKTEFRGLILEDEDPGRLVSRLCQAAVDLLAFHAEKGWNPLELESGQSARLIPVFRNPIGLAWPQRP